MDRTTKEVLTPSGVSVEMHEFITAGEFLDINEESEKNGYTKTQLAKRLMEVAIVSINGAKDSISAAIRALPVTDYIFLSKEVNKLVTGDFTEAKTPAQS